MSTNRYLEGILAPVAHEQTLTDLTVHGTLPTFLDGRYVRNGPNPFGDVDPATYHWFTGVGMVHGLRLRDGKAEWYRNRWVRNAEVAGRLGEQPRLGPVHGGFDFAPNTNVIGHAGRTFALVEAGSNPYELTDELDTIGPCDFDGTLGGGFSAHPHRDPVTGELHTVSYFFGWGNQVRYSVVDVDGRVRRLVDVPTTGPIMLHDCAITESSVIIFDLGVIFDMDLAVGGAALPYRWEDSYPARVGVLPRDGEADDVQWFAIDPCYVFHTLNAFDDGDDVVIDLARHAKMFASDPLGPNEGVPVLERWRLHRSTGSVSTTVIADGGHEFPRVDERFAGREHRFGYTVMSSVDATGDSTFGDGIARHDFVSDQMVTRDFGAGAVVGEFVFVPAGNDAAEDDGVLMGFVHEPDGEHSHLAVLDSSTLESVAQVDLPVRIPYGFHGNWIPA